MEKSRLGEENAMHFSLSWNGGTGSPNGADRQHPSHLAARLKMQVAKTAHTYYQGFFITSQASRKRKEKA
ncbi:hypothetical protein BX661DRAFT_92473 [Kickxella alabastrina]|uniref:uncharacterized protein n=1 Tax=Kickxella alabastrina TaxID=61397 RepID=UPI00221F419C|nr:uncharacterized protein BX661DRAFT_92473 [Kickxella alabastrina]KAI7831048.1 hypothetical protein BX661DRAFT_92473 [Kickxella alabastrina]